MKKSMWAFFFMVMSSAFLFSVSAQSQVADKIELSREGGTTRGATTPMGRTLGTEQIEPVVEVYNSGQVLSISVQNYRGGAWVEIIGPREVKQSYFEVYDMGFEAVNVSGLRAGQYTIRVILGSDVYKGTFKKESYGR